MSAVPQFRIACEECHDRKIRCEPSRGKSGVSGSCEACQLNSRRCLFSLKSKTGRPKIRRSSSSVSSIQSHSGPSPTGTSSSAESSISTARSIPTAALKGRNGNNPVEIRMQPSLNDGHGLSDGRSEQLLRPLPMFASFQTAQYWDAQGEYGRESVPPRTCNSRGARSYRAMRSPTVQSAAPNDSPAKEVIDPFKSQLREMPYVSSFTTENNTSTKQRWVEARARGISAAPVADVRQCMKVSSKEDIPTVAGNRRSESVPDFLHALELCHELRSHCESMPGRPLSLLAERDSQDVRAVLDSLDKLCSKIAAFIPLRGKEYPPMDQPTFILVFAAVMQAIDRTIERLGSLIELDPSFDPGISAFDSLSSNDFDMDLDASDYTFQDQASFLSRCHPDVLAGNLLGGEASANLPEIEIEQLLSLTRLDYYLLRFKSFIAHFDPSLDLLAATTFIFRPAESTARLLSFHRCIEGILGGWRTGWCK